MNDMKDEAIRLARKIAAAFSTLPDVEAVALGGSRLGGSPAPARWFHRHRSQQVADRPCMDRRGRGDRLRDSLAGGPWGLVGHNQRDKYTVKDLGGWSAVSVVEKHYTGDVSEAHRKAMDKLAGAG